LSFKIQIVEDNDVTATMIARRLVAAGYAVSTAREGFTAIEQIYKYKPDLILLDLLLPGRSGISILETLRKSEPIVNTPVIVLTSVEDERTKRKVTELGISAYFNKPQDMQALIEEIEKILGK